MIEMRFGAAALANVRFAISPLLEAMRSVKVLDDPGGQALHLPWVVEARRLARDLDLEPLRALQPTGSYSPDFIHPPPASPLADIEDELARMTETPPAEIRAELSRGYRALPPALEPLHSDPATGVRDLAALVRAYWERVLAPHWPRIRALLEGDVLHRARQIADGGAERLFADLDPTVTWRENTLRIDKRVDDTLDLGDRGLLFVPSVFVWPAVLLITAPPWQPTLIYPARGVGMLWEPGRRSAPIGLAALMGKLRASVFLALDAPRSTTDLARELGVTAGAVSQHLAVLRDAGLVHGHRVGRVVLYLRSPAGDTLLAATNPAEREPPLGVTFGGPAAS
jgi:DNA-binding transcriptional ArsR family regulator